VYLHIANKFYLKKKDQEVRKGHVVVLAKKNVEGNSPRK
jgi:hypothetical protein